MYVKIQLNPGLGANLGPTFNLTADMGTVSPSTVDETSLLQGINVIISDDRAKIVYVTSVGGCGTVIPITITGIPTTTTTSTTLPPTTLPPTTLPPTTLPPTTLPPTTLPPTTLPPTTLPPTTLPPVADPFLLSICISEHTATTINAQFQVVSNTLPITEIGMMISKVTGATLATSLKHYVVTSGTTQLFTGLTPNTLYYINVYAINSTGIHYGNECTDTTLISDYPIIITSEPQSYGVSAVNSGGQVTYLGKYSNGFTNQGIIWSTSSGETYTLGAPYVTEDSFLPNSYTFNSQVYPDFGVEYFYRAYVIQTGWTLGPNPEEETIITYGNEISFTRLTGLPDVSTISFSNLANTTVTMSGNVLEDNGYAVTDRGIVYGTTRLLNLGDDFALSVEAASGGTGAFSIDATELIPGTTYYFRAYASNSVGTAYGADELYFTTPNNLYAAVIVTNTSSKLGASIGNVYIAGTVMMGLNMPISSGSTVTSFTNYTGRQTISLIYMSSYDVGDYGKIVITSSTNGIIYGETITGNGDIVNEEIILPMAIFLDPAIGITITLSDGEYIPQ